MRAGGLEVLELPGLRMVRRSSDVDPAQVASVQGPQASPAAAELARRVAEANSRVSARDLLLNPMAGLEGLLDHTKGFAGHG